MTALQNRIGLGRLTATLAGLFAGLLLAGQALAYPYQNITIDTSGHVGETTSLHFRLYLNSTSGGLFNSATVGAFETDGSLDYENLSNATGSLLGGGSIYLSGAGVGYFDYFADLTLGNYIKFQIGTSNNDPDAPADADTFEFTLEDLYFGAGPLFNSTDANGQLGRVTYASGYSPLATFSDVVTAAVPEPGTFALFGIAMAGLIAARRRQGA